jgi:CPA1 family monovalent cation:H+ antiporter
MASGTIFTIVAVFVTVVALASYLNYRFFRLPMAIGLMVIGLALSFILIGLHAAGLPFDVYAQRFLRQVNFSEVLMRGLLSFLLFAGALQVDLHKLRQDAWAVGSLATVGVLMSIFLVGTAVHFVLNLVGIPLSYGYCLVFGALISPTDPVAIIAILNSVRSPGLIYTEIAGESLFNDGLGVVAFMIMLGLARSAGPVTVPGVLALVGREALGGIAFGLVVGWLAYRMLKSVDNYTVEILLTLALVSGGYALATFLGVSGPLSMVVAGLLVGSRGRAHAMSEVTRRNLDMFWELVDAFLNAVLFVWIGLEVLVLSFTWGHLLAGLMAVPIVLLARLASVGSSVSVLKIWHRFPPRTVLILTWGGLRGALAIAMALSLPAGGARLVIVPVTYVIVVFSVLVQGLTIKRLFQPPPESASQD